MEFFSTMRTLVIGRDICCYLLVATLFYYVVMPHMHNLMCACGPLLFLGFSVLYGRHFSGYRHIAYLVHRYLFSRVVVIQRCQLLAFIRAGINPPLIYMILLNLEFSTAISEEILCAWVLVWKMTCCSSYHTL